MNAPRIRHGNGLHYDQSTGRIELKPSELLVTTLEQEALRRVLYLRNIQYLLLKNPDRFANQKNRQRRTDCHITTMYACRFMDHRTYLTIHRKPEWFLQSFPDDWNQDGQRPLQGPARAFSMHTEQGKPIHSGVILGYWKHDPTNYAVFEQRGEGSRYDTCSLRHSLASYQNHCGHRLRVTLHDVSPHTGESLDIQI